MGGNTGPVSGASAGATSVNASQAIERCPQTLGTLAIDDSRRAAWWGEFTRSTQLTTIEPLIRVMVSQSNCFEITSMGNADLDDAMTRMMDKGRDGEYRIGSNVGKNQAIMADYFLQPAIQFTNNSNSTYKVVGGMVGGLVGSMVGNISKRQAEVTLTLMNIRSRTQISAAVGTATTTDLGGIFQMVGAASTGQLSGFERTPEGKTTVAAFVDAYNQMVIAVRNYKQREIAGGAGTGGLLKAQGQ
ncbi:hypothetical protein [Nitrospirillum pindoramense]|nr:hypothetical protein [Nitrospirillum amazonense]